MKQRSFFAGVLVVLFGVMAYWANRLEVRLAQVDVGSDLRGLASTIPESIVRTQGRRDLLEVLDRLVAYQHYYHSVYGHFTKLMHRTGLVLPPQVLAQYAVHVAEASDDRVLIVATSERDGKTVDLISVDQDFRVQANFPLPVPHADFLKSQALRHLRQLREAPDGQWVEEQGIFKGYFRYEVRKDSQGRRVAFATGFRAPVLGVHLEGEVESPTAAAHAQKEGGPLLAFRPLAGLGQKTSGEPMSGTEQAYLAQRIFEGEVGRSARDLRELGQITHFSFQDEAVGTVSPNQLEGATGDRLSIESIDKELPLPKAPPAQPARRNPAGAASVSLSGSNQPLIIEPIEPTPSR